MISTVVKKNCVICGKGKSFYKCGGCKRSFCLHDLIVHDQQLTQQLDGFNYQSNLLRQVVNQYQPNSLQYPPLQEINQWELDSIARIQSTAEEARNSLRTYNNICMPNIETQLNRFNEEIKELKDNNDFIENHLDNLQTQLEQLQAEVNQLNCIEIKQDSILIKKINVIISSSKQPNLRVDTKWDQNGVTIVNRTGEHQGHDQPASSFGMDVDNDQTVYIADRDKHCIVEWKKGATQGQIVAGGNGKGHGNNQLNHPINVILDHHHDFIIADLGNRRIVRWARHNNQHGEAIISNIDCRGMAVDKNGYLYTLDSEKGEVRQWKKGEKKGKLVAGGYGRGDHLNQFSQPRYIFVDEKESIYVSDHGNHRVMKWAKGATVGTVVAGGQGRGATRRHLAHPHGIFVDRSETVYVADLGNDRIIRWRKGLSEGEIVVGEYGQGQQANQLFAPIDLTFDSENNLYVADHGNQRVQKFSVINTK